MPSDMAFRRHFGSWGNALRAAGFEPQRPHPSEKCIENTVKAHKGKCSFNWKGGRRKNERGYIEVWMPDHPNANQKGYVLEHRLVISQHLGRPLRDDEEVHHIDGVKDHNKIDNLQLLTKVEHTLIHHKGKRKNRRNQKQCWYAGCNNITSSIYGLCRRHYKIQWQRVKFGRIQSIYQLPELLTDV